MSDPIDRKEAVEAVKNEMLSWLEGDSHDYRKVVDAIMDLPTVDTVEIIRCKDCKHRFEGEMFPNCCEVLMEMSHWLVEIPVKDEWHCGSGERKEE